MLLENQTYPRDVRVRNEARSLVREGHAVTVVAPRGPGEAAREAVDGVTVRRYRLPVSAGGVGGFVREYLVAHLQLFARGCAELARGARVVHLHNPPDTLFPIALLARAIGRKVVFDHHDLSPELYREKFGPSRSIEAALRLAQRASFRAAHTVLVTNESQRDVALGQGAPAERVTIVRNGPRRAMLAQRRPQREGVLRDPVLVFLGELDSQDGVGALPSLLRRVVDQPETPEATMLIVGDGPLLPELERGMREVGLADRVRFTGRVDHALVPGLLAGGDICIDPAPCSPLNDRSTMIKVVEYLVAGRPVVAYDLRETRRTAGAAALYAGCGDEAQFARHIAAAAADPAVRKSLIVAGQAHVSGLLWECSEAELLGAYSRLGTP